MTRMESAARTPLTLMEDATVPEIWADGAVLTDDGAVVRAVFFADRHRGDGAVIHAVVLRTVMSVAGFAWSLHGAILLPAARHLVDLAGLPLLN